MKAIGFRRGDLVRFKEGLMGVTDFRVSDTLQGAVCVTCRIGGHLFSGYIPETDLVKVGASDTV